LTIENWRLTKNRQSAIANQQSPIANQQSAISYRNSYAALRYQAGEMLERTIVSALRFRRKKASGKLPSVHMVLQALTTRAFPRARFIRTIALFLILILHAFHNSILLIQNRQSEIYL
jgi:hypothetical protein